MKMKYYHMIVEPIGNWPGETLGRMEYISPTQGAAPNGYRCVGVCGFHEKPKQVQYPCRNCVYYATCGDSMRTMQCDGRKTKREMRNGNSDDF